MYYFLFLIVIYIPEKKKLRLLKNSSSAYIVYAEMVAIAEC
jgi:hypothetical protein